MGVSVSIVKSELDATYFPLLCAAFLFVAGYYCGAMAGFMLAFQPAPLSIIWPSNAILMDALLLVPAPCWWIVCLAIFSTHLAANLQVRLPTEMVPGWFISDCSGVSLGAICAGKILGQRLRFDFLRDIVLFILFCVLFSPFTSSFLDVAFINIFGWGEGDYRELWRFLFLTHALAILIIVPTLLTWTKNFLLSMRKASGRRQGEAVLFAIVLSGVSIAAFVFIQHKAFHVLLLLCAAFAMGYVAIKRFSVLPDRRICTFFVAICRDTGT